MNIIILSVFALALPSVFAFSLFDRAARLRARRITHMDHYGTRRSIR